MKGKCKACKIDMDNINIFTGVCGFCITFVWNFFDTFFPQELVEAIKISGKTRRKELKKIKKFSEEMLKDAR